MDKSCGNGEQEQKQTCTPGSIEKCLPHHLKRKIPCSFQVMDLVDKEMQIFFTRSNKMRGINGLRQKI